MYEKLRTRLDAFEYSLILHIWLIQSFPQYLNFVIHILFRIYFLRKLYALRFPYKHSNFGTDMLIYPECNTRRHLIRISVKEHVVPCQISSRAINLTAG